MLFDVHLYADEPLNKDPNDDKSHENRYGFVDELVELPAPVHSTHARSSAPPTNLALTLTGTVAFGATVFPY